MVIYGWFPPERKTCKRFSSWRQRCMTLDVASFMFFFIIFWWSTYMHMCLCILTGLTPPWQHTHPPPKKKRFSWKGSLLSDPRWPHDIISSMCRWVCEQGNPCWRITVCRAPNISAVLLVMASVPGKKEGCLPQVSEFFMAEPPSLLSGQNGREAKIKSTKKPNSQGTKEPHNFSCKTAWRLCAAGKLVEVDAIP